mmetsp:Transcript_28548/g.64635  ORF Transcript_28548/g.64635 Transcript_28548/m.64635 type:complete len:217 (-) Transcript_28548:427-1077(-)
MALSAHHASARKIVLQVDRLLDELESGRDTSVSMQSTISQHLNTLARELDALERLLPELALQERNMWRKKISQLQEQTNSQRASLSKFSSKLQQRMRDAEERAALLQGKTNGDHAISIEDGLIREGQAISSASSQLDGLTGNATSILSSLVDQTSTIKGVQRKVLDMATTLGVSNNVIRMIERRQFWDKVLLYGGMLFTLFLLWFSFVHLRREGKA